MIQRSVRKADTGTPRMHAGSRFGDVVVGRQTDRELCWFFNESPAQMGQQSSFSTWFTGRDTGSLEASEASAYARHEADKIWGCLQIIGARDEKVLDNLYTDRPWPGTLVRRFGPVVGVVEGLVAVRALHIHEHIEKRTSAPNTTAWLEERVARCCKDLVAWRKEAFRVVEQALKAYGKARDKGPTIVLPEDR